MVQIYQILGTKAIKFAVSNGKVVAVPDQVDGKDSAWKVTRTDSEILRYTSTMPNQRSWENLFIVVAFKEAINVTGTITGVIVRLETSDDRTTWVAREEHKYIDAFVINNAGAYLKAYNPGNKIIIKHPAAVNNKWLRATVELEGATAVTSGSIEIYRDGATPDTNEG